MKVWENSKKRWKHSPAAHVQICPSREATRAIWKTLKIQVKIILKAPAKRLQHANTTYRNIVGRNMLRAFGHLVATCCDLLGVVGSNLTSFKLEPTTPNLLQHMATWWPNARNMLRPTMLRHVGLICCDRLAGA